METKNKIRCPQCDVLIVYRNKEIMEDNRERYVNCLGCGNKIHLSWVNKLGDRVEIRL